MKKKTFSLMEAESLQNEGWKVKTISGNPKQYVMEKADVKEIKEEVKVENVKE